MRFPTRARDFWQVASGEARHRATPETFWIPSLTQREGLRRGQAAKLLFEIEGQDEKGEQDVWTERMWVLVTERLQDGYLGILTNQPAGIEPTDAFYLQERSEIPFRAEHVIDIDDPPPDFVAEVLTAGPRRSWPRDDAAA
jgi:hypothetical protein